jgi:hypothetical protein
MEGGFETQRGTARPGPSFEPPQDPGGPSLRGLSLVARIMRGRELAGDAAGIPPLDSDQVLDLQRTAGNRLTAGALARWTDPLALSRFGTPADALREEPSELLDWLLPARASDPTAHAAICAALDAVDPLLELHLSCVAGDPAPLSISVAGSAPLEIELGHGEAATATIHFAAAFGPAAAVTPETSAALTLATPAGERASAELRLPLGAPLVLELGERRLVAVADISPPA